MIRPVSREVISNNGWTWVIIAGVIVGSVALSVHASIVLIGLLGAGLGAAVLLQRPTLGLFVLIFLSMILPLEFSTGTEVRVNPTTLLVPALLAVWFLTMVRQRRLHLAASRPNRPLLLFLLAGLVSLIIGQVLWDPGVPQAANLVIVQLAQWAVFAFSAGAFWLMGNQVKSEALLRALTFFYLAIAGSLAIAWVASNGNALVYNITTYVVVRAPFWMLLSAVACGQLLFNRELSLRWQCFLVAVLASVFYFSFFMRQERSSNWMGVIAVIGMLIWLRWPRWRRVFVILAVVGGGFLYPLVYQFAGGDAKWDESGGSRLVLINRVIEVTMRNPITGLGPAAYRAYARMTPLVYDRAYWLTPTVNSHNNYVDLFSFVGVLGLGILLWFIVEIVGLGIRLRRRYPSGFAAGYINGMLAAGAGSLTLMGLADWILPHVYNIGFPGFQSSVLVWLFLGGLLTLEKLAPPRLG